MKVPLFRTAYNYDREAASDASGFSSDEPSLTQQQFAEECDINTIVRRFGVTGQVPATLSVPLQGDFENAPDFRGAMDLLVRAREAFMELPADVRARFHHDPGELVEFVSNRDNLPEARKLGILTPEPVPVPPPQPMPVRVVSDDPDPLPSKNAP